MRIRLTTKKAIPAFVTMSDIAFLLLIFLVIASSMNDVESIDLPKFAFSRKTGFPQIISLEVGSSGDYRLDGQVMTGTELSTWLQGLNSGRTVVRVLADRNAQYSEVDAALKLLSVSGFESIILVAENDGREE